MTGIEIALVLLLAAAIGSAVVSLRYVHFWRTRAINAANSRDEQMQLVEDVRAEKISGYTDERCQLLTAQLAEAAKDLGAVQLALKAVTEARDAETSRADGWRNQFDRLADRFSPEQVRILEMIGFLLNTTAQEWNSHDARWLKNALSTGHGFKFREMIRNTSNNYMIHAVSNPPEGTREWRAGCAMAFRSLLTMFEIYEKDDNFGDPPGDVAEIARDRAISAPNGTAAAVDRARFTP